MQGPAIRSSPSAATVRAGVGPTLGTVDEWQAPTSVSEVDSLSMPSVPSVPPSATPSAAVSPAFAPRTPPERTTLMSFQGTMPTPVPTTLPPRPQSAYPTFPPSVDYDRSMEPMP